MVGTGKLSCVPWCKFHDSWFLEYLTINILIFFSRTFAGKIALSSSSTTTTTTTNDRETQSLGALWLFSLRY